MKYWKFSPGRGARFWDFCKDNECAAIGWSRIGSLLDFQDLEQLSKAFDGQKWASRKWNTGDTQLWNLKKYCKNNDVIVSYGKGYILSVGSINEEYYYGENKIDEEWDDWYCHRIGVEWYLGTTRNIKNNSKLFGNPPHRYGTINKQLTFYEIIDQYTIDFINKLLKLSKQGEVKEK